MIQNHGVIMKEKFWSEIVTQIRTEGVYCHCQRLAEGLVHWDSLFLSF